MTTRLYFLVPNELSAKKVTDALHAHQIEDSNIYAVAKREKYPLAEGIPEADLLQRTDLVNAAKRGATVGGTAGLFAGLGAALIAPMGLIAAGAAVAGLSLAGATFGTWTSTMIGISVRNSDLGAFHAAIDEGQILMLVDVEDSAAEKVKASVQLAYPYAVISSGVLESEKLIAV